MKFVILGDVHLGKGTNIGKPGSGGVLNSRVQDQIQLLDWVLEQTKLQGAETIIITGDIYEDQRPHPELIKIFLAWLKKCERDNIFVHVIVGNHDIIKTGHYTVSALDLVPAIELPNVQVHKKVGTFHYPGVSFTFLPYRDRRMYDALSPDQALQLLHSEFKDEPIHAANGLKILVGHLAIEGSLFIGDEIDDMLNEIFCPISIFKDYHYVWMGHIHKPQVLSEQPYIAHVGSMDRSDFSKGEMDHDKVLILIDPENTPHFQQITIPTRPLRKALIEVPPGVDTTDFVINQLDKLHAAESLDDSILRIEVQLIGQEAANSDRNKINQFLQKLNVHHVCQFSESRTIQPVKLQEQALFDNKMNVPAAINAYVDNMELEAEPKQKVRELLLDVYKEFQT